MSEIKPDVIIPYIQTDSPMNPLTVVYVRPQTNKLNYETAIIKGVQDFGDIIYLANLNGKLFIKNALILEHYSTQYIFSIYAKHEIAKYPEMIDKFESHFKVKFDEANIIGSFDALLSLNIDSETLFNTMVDDCDFLRMYEQTIKKIDNLYIVNYDIPAIIKKYDPESNIFVVAARFKDKNLKIEELNQAIFDNLKNNMSTPIIDEDKYKHMEWWEKVRRTYHISGNNIAACFDMIDFVYNTKGNNVTFDEIPFTHSLISKGIITQEKLAYLKNYNLVRTNPDGKLINIAATKSGLSFEECEELIKTIKWESPTPL